MQTEKTTWTMGQTPTDKVIQKIKKLLNLAANASTEGEAAAAANTAQQILASYNLEMSQIDAVSLATPDGKRVKDTHTRSALFQYQRDLWKALAEANYCWYEASPVWSNGRKRTYKHYLIGREANTITTKLIGDYLEERMNKLCPFRGPGSSFKSSISWKEGCAARLIERLGDKLRDMIAANTPVASVPSNSMAITLRQVVQTEDDENYRFVHGEDSYNYRMARRHDRKNCVCQYCVSHREMVREYESRRALQVQEPEPIETEAQRRKRLLKSEKAAQRWREKQQRANERHWAKKDVSAYASGRVAGEDIGLDGQLGAAKDSSTGHGAQALTKGQHDLPQVRWTARRPRTIRSPVPEMRRDSRPRFMRRLWAIHKNRQSG